MSTLSNIPEARFDWIVETMRLLRSGMPSAERGDRFNAVHALMTLGFAYAEKHDFGCIYWLSKEGRVELQRIEGLKGGANG